MFPITKCCISSTTYNNIWSIIYITLFAWAEASARLGLPTKMCKSTWHPLSFSIWMLMADSADMGLTLLSSSLAYVWYMSHSQVGKKSLESHESSSKWLSMGLLYFLMFRESGIPKLNSLWGLVITYWEKKPNGTRVHWHKKWLWWDATGLQSNNLPKVFIGPQRVWCGKFKGSQFFQS